MFNMDELLNKMNKLVVDVESLKKKDSYMYWSDLLIYCKPFELKDKDGNVIEKEDSLRIQRTTCKLNECEIKRILRKLKQEDGMSEKDPDRRKLSENGPIAIHSDNYELYLGDGVVIKTVNSKSVHVYSGKKEE